MFKKTEFDLFKKYCRINSVSSFENNVCKQLIQDYKKLDLELIYDNIGNIFALKKSKNPHAFKLLIDGHMDEVGFIVRRILKNGLINCQPIGGISLNSVASQRFLLTNKEGKTFVGCVDILSIKEDSKVNDLNFDFGFKDEQDAQKNNIKMGDMVSFIGETVLINNKERLMSKAIDDRYGIVLGLEILKYFKNIDLDFDLYVGGSVQEEVGLRGTKVSPNHIQPDLVIVLDCSPSRETIQDDGQLGKGVLIRYHDASMIAKPKFLSFQEEVLKKHHIKYQFFKALGGTNAGAYHTSLEGVNTLTHCICARNLHSANTIIDSGDYQSAKKGLIKILLSLNHEKIASLIQQQ